MTDDLKKLREEATEVGDWSADENTIWSNGRGVPVADVRIGAPVWYKGPKLPYEANAALIVAAVNAVPELLALREENERLRKQVSELSDCQQLPKVYKYTGTAEVDVENMFDVGHRHKSGKQPRDYLMSWLSMLRPFAYATRDDSWGEMEKLLSIVMGNYVQTLVKAEAARAALQTKGTP